jgi:predicted acetyltransferase
MAQTIRTIKPEELPAWFEASSSAFYIWAQDPHATALARRDTIEIDRVVGAFEDDLIVGTFRSFGSQLTLPGGARVPVNAVSAVTVRPTHRRQGTLSRMVADDTARAAARGDAASVLISAEWPIYGRFGYGPATWQARWTLRVRAAKFRAKPVGSVQTIDPLTARKLLPGIYERYAAGQPGELARQEHRWDVDLGIVEMPGRPRWRGQVVIHRDDAGEPDGYARYHGEEHWEDGIPDNLMLLDELHGVSVAAEIDLWRFLAQVDLTATIRADTRRERELLPWYLSDARAARVTNLSDMLWVRLLDVERVLGERRYEREGDLVIEVDDQVDGTPGPAAGRYRLTVRDGSGTCRRTDDQPDLSVDVRALGAAVLGGTRLIDATRAGGATQHRPGALAEADALLRTADAPWCSTWF